MTVSWRCLGVAALCGTLAMGIGGLQAEDELNLYSARHYQTDEALYENFTKQTGIKINRIEGKGDELLQRILSEGANSPADVLLTVDVGRLHRAEEAGLFQAVESSVLETAIPENLRHPDGLWYSFSTRARLIFYDKAKIAEGEINAYEDLADPKWKGKVCIRESGNVYNQSLLASMVEVHGEEGAEQWAKDVMANFARAPVKGDTNQLRGIGTGECEVAVANSYYYVRLLTEPQARRRGPGRKAGRGLPQPARPGHPRQCLRCRRLEDGTPSGSGSEVPGISGKHRGADLFRRREQRVSGGGGCGAQRRAYRAWRFRGRYRQRLGLRRASGGSPTHLRSGRLALTRSRR